MLYFTPQFSKNSSMGLTEDYTMAKFLLSCSYDQFFQAIKVDTWKDVLSIKIFFFASSPVILSSINNKILSVLHAPTNTLKTMIRYTETTQTIDTFKTLFLGALKVRLLFLGG